MNFHKGINKKIFLLLWISGTIASVTVVPYIYHVSTPEGTSFPIDFSLLFFSTLLQAAVILAICLILTLKIYPRLHFKLPILEAWTDDRLFTVNWKALIYKSLFNGILIAVIIITGEIIFYSLDTPISLLTIPVPKWWSALLTAFYGSITEEIIFRFFLITIFTWFSWKFIRDEDNYPTKTGIWIAIVISAIVFGIFHLPLTNLLTDLNIVMISRTLLLNGIPGIILGWLYWKKGLEHAMLSSFFADILVHGLLQIIL